MLTLHKLQSALRKQISKSRVEIVFSGSNDREKQAAMSHTAAPIDRIYACSNDEKMELTTAFDITYGNICFASAKYDKQASRIDHNEFEFSFKNNHANSAVEIKGGIQSLGIPNDTVLFSGSVEPSLMILKQSRKRTALPYIVFHSKFEVNTQLLNAFGLKQGDSRVALSGWTKDPTLLRTKISKKEATSDSGQHLGYLRIF